MTLSIWIYGALHYDPGTRQKFLEKLAEQHTAPHFVAVEWEKSVFEKFVEWRRGVEECLLKSGLKFLTPADCRELSLALAWEGDAYAELFPRAEPLWLENGFQTAHFTEHHNDKWPKCFAENLISQLLNPCEPTRREFFEGTNRPPAPRSKKDLIDRLWKKGWMDMWGESPLDRDARWANSICKRSTGLCDGWIAVVVGWQHADPKGNNQRLRGLLMSKGFDVKSVYLGPTEE